MAYHHSTIRSYTAALLDFFNGLEVQYTDSLGTTLIRNVPIVYSSREKTRILDDYTSEQFRSGNYNVLPRANLAMSTMVKSEQRTTNKNIKVGVKSNVDTLDYMWNSVPYEFTFELAIICRGMNEATQIVEQIAPKFNPTVNIDVWDAQNLNEPTRVPVKLLDIGIEQEEYEEVSSNLVTVSIGLSIIGNLYPPISSADRVKEFKIKMNGFDNDVYTTDAIYNWDVDTGGNAIKPRTTTFDPTKNFPPVIIDLVPTTPFTESGPNSLTVIYSDGDNSIQDLTFDWALIQGDGTIAGNLDTAEVVVNVGGTFEPQVTITDIYGNFSSLSKVLEIRIRTFGVWETLIQPTNTAYQRSDFGSATSGDLIYMYGGKSDSGLYSSDLITYNVVTNTVQTINTGQGPSINGGSIEIVGDYMYLFGGSTSANAKLNTVRKYNLITGIWSSTVVMPQGSVDNALTAKAGTTIMVFNGFSVNGSPTLKTSLYDTVTDTFTSVSPLDLVSGLLVSDGTDFYISGGYVSSGSLYPRHLKYEVLTDTWVTLANIPISNLMPIGDYYDGVIYMADIHNGTSTVLTFRQYNIATDTWTSGSSLLNKNVSGSLLQVNGDLYQIGGNTLGLFANGFNAVPEINRLGVIPV